MQNAYPTTSLLFIATNTGVSSFLKILVNSSFVYFVVPDIKISGLNLACSSSTSLNNLLTFSISFISAFLTVTSIAFLLKL